MYCDSMKLMLISGTVTLFIYNKRLDLIIDVSFRGLSFKICILKIMMHQILCRQNMFKQNCRYFGEYLSKLEM